MVSHAGRVQIWGGAVVSPSFPLPPIAGRDCGIRSSGCDVIWGWAPYWVSSVSLLAEVGMLAPVHPRVRVGAGLQCAVAVPLAGDVPARFGVAGHFVTEFLLTAPAQ